LFSGSRYNNNISNDIKEANAVNLNCFSGSGYAGHASQLAPTLVELAKLEKEAQIVFLKNFYGRNKK
jgi:hypothetical protein